MPKENLPIVAGITVTTDAIDRFNLNAIHKASGEGEHKRPSKWLATAQSQELIYPNQFNLIQDEGTQTVQTVRQATTTLKQDLRNFHLKLG